MELKTIKTCQGMKTYILLDGAVMPITQIHELPRHLRVKISGIELRSTGSTRKAANVEFVISRESMGLNERIQVSEGKGAGVQGTGEAYLGESLADV